MYQVYSALGGSNIELTATNMPDLVRGVSTDVVIAQVELPSAAGVVGRRVTIKNVGPGNLNLTANGSDTIDGQADMFFDPWQALMLQAHASGWDVIA